VPLKLISLDSNAVREVSALVTKLLAHYWTTNEHAAARQAQIEDWIDDLAEFGPAVVEQACTDWRRSEHRRPLPADIRTRCIAVQNEERERVMLEDTRRERWPQWLEELWGPEPEGPAKRLAAMGER
jgi:hypothetical protein